MILPQLRLKILVERVEFDADQCSLRLNGKNIEESEHLKLGQYHTLDIEIGKPFSITKDCWDSLYVQQLEDACNPAKIAEIAAIVMQEGLAHVCLITNTMTLTKAKIERSVPKKKLNSTAADKSREKFFVDICEAVKRHVDFSIVKVVLIGR